MTEKTFLRDLGDGLILRRATSTDADALAEFNGRIHSDDGPERPNQYVAAWTRDLLERPHPTLQPGDFTIVEDSRSRAIVSSLNLISQTWSYEGIPFGVGRPELVGTLPEYRHRGLMRAQFDLIHEWSAKRGEQVQAITGIPYFYRKFGYEMALNLGGGRVGYKPLVPRLKEGQAEPYRLRPAEETDLPFIAQLYQHSCQRYPINCLRDQAIWRYELNGKSQDNINRTSLYVINSQDGESVGFLGTAAQNWGPTLVATIYEVKPGVSWGAVTPSVIRFLYATGEANSMNEQDGVEFAAFGFWLGEQHPVYQVAHDALPRHRKPYAWYLRVADLVGFVRHVAPALEKRLENSPYTGHSGELKITFYRRGLRLALQAGRLVEIEDWQPEPTFNSGDAAFPELTFLQLLFGYRSLDELRYAFPDCWWENDVTYGLLNALFPRLPSDIWMLA